MKIFGSIALVLALGVGPGCAQVPSTRAFTVTSADGTAVHGQVDLPAFAPSTVVIMVGGTGLRDRDESLGSSGTARDLVFVDLAQRMNKRGVAAVRYDKRGIRQGRLPMDRFDRAAAATATVETMRDDLGAIYEWVRSEKGLNARCVVLFGHSEGMAHIGRLAAKGAPAPVLVIGMGAALESPATVMHWQAVERDAFSLKMMDVDRDGRVTNAEVEANWRRTPSAVHEQVAPYLHPSGAWSAADLETLRTNQSAIFEQVRAQVMAMPDTAPYPDVKTATAAYSWWKSWFIDDTPIASRLAAWQTPMSFHYGTIDSQTNAERQRAAAGPIASRARFTIHADRGHTLGSHVFLGPIDEAIADQIADEAAAVRCGQ